MRHATVVDFDAAKDGELGILTGGSTKKNFKFDRVYTPKDDQGIFTLQKFQCLLWELVLFDTISSVAFTTHVITSPPKGMVNFFFF